MTDLTHSPPPVATPGRLLAATRTAAARRAAPLAFLIAVVGYLIGTLSQAPKLFYYDSGVYWSLGASFSSHGHFSLLNFNSPLRGYLLPLVDRGLHALANVLTLNDSTPAKVFNCLIFALIATVLLPALAEIAWPTQRWGVARRLVLAAVLGVLWGGYLAFPLSDFPAAAVVLLALIATARSDRVSRMLVAGLACGAAIDMRPAYVILPLGMLLVLGGSWWRDRTGPRSVHLRRAACLAAALLGFALVTTPQALATHHHGGGWEFIPGSQAHLSNLQYNEGLHLQRYDTYVGVGEPAAQMSYVDPTGTRLLRRNGKYINSTSQYVKVILHHPLTMLGIFARHVINGIDQRYNTPYVEHVPPEQPLRVLSFAFVFLTLMRIGWRAARRSLGPASWRYIVAVLVSDATAMASAIEPRFMVLPACVTYITVLAPGWSEVRREEFPRSRRIILAVSVIGAGLAFVLLVHSVTTGAGQHLTFGS